MSTTHLEARSESPTAHWSGKTFGVWDGGGGGGSQDRHSETFHCHQQYNTEAVLQSDGDKQPISESKHKSGSLGWTGRKE